MAFATLGYNLLRWMGLRLTGPEVVPGQWAARKEKVDLFRLFPQHLATVWQWEQDKMQWMHSG
jgi:hypothetical protein